MYIFLVLFVLISVPSYANFTDNLRWSLDTSARLNKNVTTNNTSLITAFGLDSHKVFTSPHGDIGYAVGQLYFTKLSNQVPVPWLFNSKNDSKFVIREAHLNYTASTGWMPNVRIGRFVLPFGLEESIDTSGHLFDYYHSKNLGTKLDWGLGFNKVFNHGEYSFSYTLGGKDDPKTINNSYALSGRIGSPSYLDFVFGFSFYSGKIDNIQRRRFALDWQYYWGTWGVVGEVALGKDKTHQQKWQDEQYYLLELNKTSINEQLKLYAQYIFVNRDDANSHHKLINLGLSYQVNEKLELSISSRKQLNTPASGKKQNLVRLQVRYRY
jgi:hypothetical protein